MERGAPLLLPYTLVFLGEALASGIGGFLRGVSRGSVRTGATSFFVVVVVSLGSLFVAFEMPEYYSGQGAWWRAA
ncbi:hypothetical protein JB92DRAFT_2897616 [Gautieria morchelliformis]|nr:hypothetical protein JB92DRAFT_2897616 [Gautieria morchelliformis]